MTQEECLALWRALLRASRLIEESVRRTADTHGLCASDLAVLDQLREHGSLSVSALGQAVALTSGSITSAVHRLCDRGLVARRGCKEDARSKMVDLLPTGRHLAETATRDQARALARAFSVLDASERRHALALLEKLAAGPEIESPETMRSPRGGRRP